MLKVLTSAFLILASSTAMAHVSLQNPTAATGSYYKAELGVPHGCEETATTAVIIHIPEGFIVPKPMPKAGWTTELVKDGDGIVTAVKFLGGHLPDAFYDEFVVRGKIMAPANSTLYFKVSQVCEKGQIDWFGIPAEGQDGHSLPAPAASLKVTAGSSGHH